MENGLPLPGDIARQSDQNQQATFVESVLAPPKVNDPSDLVPAFIHQGASSPQAPTLNQQQQGTSSKPTHAEQQIKSGTATGASQQRQEQPEHSRKTVAAKPTQPSKPKPSLPTVMKASLERMEKAQKEVLQARLELFSLGFAKEEDIAERLKPAAHKVS